VFDFERDDSERVCRQSIVLIEQRAPLAGSQRDGGIRTR